MAVTISIMYVALLGLQKISIIWRPFISRCISLRMLSSLNTFKRTGIPVLLIPHLPPSTSPPRLGCGIVILLQSSINWHRIILVYLARNAFVIFNTTESTFVICLKYCPICYRYLIGSSYRILGIQLVVAYLAYQ